MNENLQITQRILELAKNPLKYSIHPKSFKEEHIFLSNVLNTELRSIEREFKETFRIAVNKYKFNLKETGTGFFGEVDKLLWQNMQINQLMYVIYGDRFVHEYKWNEKLGNKAYLDLINQIDSTALMTPRQLKKHNDDCSRIGMEILNEILAEEKGKK